MLAKLEINGVDFSGLVAREGIKQSEVSRQAKTIVTLNGIEHRKSITKRRLDVAMVEMRESRLIELTDALTQPCVVTYLDNRMGETTKTFWVEGMTNVQKVVEGRVTYISGVSFSLVER